MASSPEVREMNDTQWLFELEGLYFKEEQRFDEIKVLAQVFKRGVIDVLGLNLMPVEDEIPIEERDAEYLGAIGEEKVFRRLRHPKEHEIIPLSILMGREEIVAEIIKRQKELHDQEDMEKKEEKGEIVQMSPEELDAFMNEGIEGDLTFLDDPAALQKKMIWESEEYQAMNKALVKPMSAKDVDPIYEGRDAPHKPSRRSRGTKSKVTLG